mgnify:CR=1 FL=1
MANQQIQFQPGMSIPEFLRCFGTEAQCFEAVKLAQRATLETRQAKHEPRTFSEQRAVWREQALAVLDGPRALEAMLHAARRRTSRTGRRSRCAASATNAVRCVSDPLPPNPPPT